MTATKSGQQDVNIKLQLLMEMKMLMPAVPHLHSYHGDKWHQQLFTGVAFEISHLISHMILNI